MPTLTNPTRRDWHLCLEAATHGYEEWRDEAIEAFLRRELLAEQAKRQKLQPVRVPRRPSIWLPVGLLLVALSISAYLFHIIWQGFAQ
jgi:hypothetical protein